MNCYLEQIGNPTEIPQNDPESSSVKYGKYKPEPCIKTGTLF